MTPEDQALIEAHVERLVAVELAHRKEIATLQAMVVELRGKLGEAERLLNSAPVISWAGDPWTRWCVKRDAFLAPSPPDSPVSALPCGCIAHPWGGSCPKPAAPPVSTVDSRLAEVDGRLRWHDDQLRAIDARMREQVNLRRALEAGVAALEKFGKGEVGTTATAVPADAAAPTQAAPVSPEPHAFVLGEGENRRIGWCCFKPRPHFICALPNDHPIHAVPGAAKP